VSSQRSRRGRRSGIVRPAVAGGLCAFLAAVLTSVVDAQPASRTGAPTASRSVGQSRSPATVPTASRSSTSSGPSTAPAELPRGGTRVFPRFRLVGYSGGPGTAAFGRLGVGDLDARVGEIERVGRAYRGRGPSARQVLPVLELIAVVAHRTPGPDRAYSSPIDSEVIDRYLAAARRHKALLLLNVQPGRRRFIDAIRPLEPWLSQPDVHLALDPEWAVSAPGVPGRVFGSVSGAELDRVSASMAALVAQNRLPEKVIVVHQLAPSIVRSERALRPRPGVVMVKSVDGIGTPGAKVATWQRLTRPMSPALHPGFKLFFEEDAEGSSRLMRPAEVMALRPTPDYVLYE